MLDSNEQLIMDLKRQGALLTRQPEDAFRAVDRARFLGSGVPTSRGYENNPVRERFQATMNGRLYTAPVVHLSAPYIYARVAEAMELRPGMTFLNIGSGIGYFSTIVAKILGPDSVCHGIEMNAPLVEAAQALSDEFCTQTQCAKMHFLVGDGFEINVDDNILYDRVYVGAGVNSQTANYFLKLVKPGGVLIGPFDDELRKYTVGPPETSYSVLMSVRFSPLERDDADKLWVDGGGMIIEPAVWTPKLASFRSAKYSFQRALMAVMMLQNRYIQGFPKNLGQHLWHYIFSFCPRSWFERPLTEVEMLQYQLKCERELRIELQNRVEKAEHQRAQAMTFCNVMRLRVQQLTRVALVHTAAADEGEDFQMDEDRLDDADAIGLEDEADVTQVIW